MPNESVLALLSCNVGTLEEKINDVKCGCAHAVLQLNFDLRV